MINNINLIFFLIFILISGCSFDSKTGIWDGEDDERIKISDLEKRQKEIIDIYKVYTSNKTYSKEVSLSEQILLSNPKKNLSWEMSGLNNQNFLGNIYLPSIENNFLKKKVGKNKFFISKTKTPFLIINNNIIISDDRGTIYNINNKGNLKWKKNIYKNTYKNIYKNLVFSIYKNIIYVADNIGFIYAIDLKNGSIIWIKNNSIPLKSNIKVYDNKIFLIDYDNKIISLNTNDGSKVWQVLSISSFIKSQSLLSLAVSTEGDLIAINSSADLFKIEANSGNTFWSKNFAKFVTLDATDFLKTSQILLSDDDIIFSADSSIYSYNILSSITNWETQVSSTDVPIVDGNNIFIVTKNGYFVILNKNTGKIISSNYILKILKKKKRDTNITGFIMGSGKIYSVTLNGFLIVSSAISGKVEKYIKIGETIKSSPIINNGKLYILTENSKIYGFN